MLSQEFHEVCLHAVELNRFALAGELYLVDGGDDAVELSTLQIYFLPNPPEISLQFLRVVMLYIMLSVTHEHATLRMQRTVLREASRTIV